MKEFFKQCLENLEPIAGHRQLFYFQSDPDGKKKMEVCILGMIESSKRFPYIPEEDQKKIISEAMITDQEYEALNSRVIWKWLNLHKDTYWGKRMTISEEEMMPKFTFDGKPITEEMKQIPSEEKVKEYVQEVTSNLAKVGLKVPQPSKEEIKAEELRDPYLNQLREQYPTTAGTRQKFIVYDLCTQCSGTGSQSDGVANTWQCEGCEGTGKINAVEVYATSQEEAEKAHKATFGT